MILLSDLNSYLSGYICLKIVSVFIKFLMCYATFIIRDSVKTKHQMLKRFNKTPCSENCFKTFNGFNSIGCFNILNRFNTIYLFIYLFLYVLYMYMQLTCFDQFVDIIDMGLISIIDTTQIIDAF